MTLLNPVQAFRFMADLWKNPKEGNPAYVITTDRFGDRRVAYCLCDTVIELKRVLQNIDSHTETIIGNIIRSEEKNYPRTQLYGYYWPRNMEGAWQRAKFCHAQACRLVMEQFFIDHIQLSESDAWLLMCDIWSNSHQNTFNGTYDGLLYVGSTESKKLQYPSGWMRIDGLCNNLGHFLGLNLITKETYDIMKRKLRIYREANNNFAGYMWPTNEDGAKQRAAFCQEQVKQIENETKKSETKNSVTPVLSGPPVLPEKLTTMAEFWNFLYQLYSNPIRVDDYYNISLTTSLCKHHFIGICYPIHYLWEAGVITDDMRKKAKYALTKERVKLNRVDESHVWATDRNGISERAAFCKRMMEQEGFVSNVVMLKDGKWVPMQKYEVEYLPKVEPLEVGPLEVEPPEFKLLELEYPYCNSVHYVMIERT